MKKSVVLALIIALGTVCFSATPGHARNEWLNDMFTAYPWTEGSRLDDCSACHIDSQGWDLRNSFGQDYGSALAILGGGDPFQGDGVQAFFDIEPIDSDGDGFTNGEELSGALPTPPGITHPGDAGYYPGGPVQCTDLDRDFYFYGGLPDCGTLHDCDDTSPGINPGYSEVCYNGIDDDCDTLVDRDDPDCADYISCQPCTDDDNDGHYTNYACGPYDCDDSDPFVNTSAQEICKDHVDNDCDGLKDRKDPDCQGGSTEPEGKGKSCSDGIDNDGDGLTDCADPDCSRNKSCK